MHDDLEGPCNYECDGRNLKNLTTGYATVMNSDMQGGRRCVWQQLCWIHYHAAKGPFNQECARVNHATGCYDQMEGRWRAVRRAIT